jgi:ankyrin repeat protein
MTGNSNLLSRVLQYIFQNKGFTFNGPSELIESTNDDGNNPLHIACQDASYADMVSVLVPYFISSSMQNNNGDTPWHIAVRNGCFDCLYNLLNKYKNAESIIYTQNNDGLTVMDIAKQTNAGYMISLLETKISAPSRTIKPLNENDFR